MSSCSEDGARWWRRAEAAVGGGGAFGCWWRPAAEAAMAAMRSRQLYDFLCKTFAVEKVRRENRACIMRDLRLSGRMQEVIETYIMGIHVLWALVCVTCRFMKICLSFNKK